MVMVVVVVMVMVVVVVVVVIVVVVIKVPGFSVVLCAVNRHFAILLGLSCPFVPVVNRNKST